MPLYCILFAFTRDGMTSVGVQVEDKDFIGIGGYGQVVSIVVERELSDLIGNANSIHLDERLGLP